MGSPAGRGGLTLEKIIREAFDKGFSDVHLGVGEVPRFRDRGQIMTTDYPEIVRAHVLWVAGGSAATRGNASSLSKP
jgi:Tfp pilus assembly pilus retraction ATPase PilT